MYCECGCGKKTNIITSRKSNKKTGYIKGQYYRFIAGHRANFRNHYKGSYEWVAERQNKFFCKCGCGNYIKVKVFHFYRQRIPDYILGHHSNLEAFKTERIQYNKTHLKELSSRWIEDRSKLRYARAQDFNHWQKEDIYVRDEGKCQSCGAFCLNDVNKQHPLKAHIHHIITIKDGGTNCLSNGQVLCLICHKYIHSVEAKKPNSGKPKAKEKYLTFAMAIPSQASEKSEGVCRDYVVSAKAMI